MIYYDYLPSSLNSTTGLRNTTAVDFTNPLNVGFIGPSITPLTGNNAGWRVYQVDAKTFSVVGAQTYWANVSASNSWTGPEWQFEYDTRALYDPQSKWGAHNPLNATFWHNLTTQMLNNITLVETYNFLETKVISVRLTLANLISKVRLRKIAPAQHVKSKKFVIFAVVPRHWDSLVAVPAVLTRKTWL